MNGAIGIVALAVKLYVERREKVEEAHVRGVAGLFVPLGCRVKI